MRHFLIWSEEHGAWWGADHRGYTRSMCQAGLYTRKEARTICHGANMGGRLFNEVAMRAPRTLDSLKAIPKGR